MTETAATNSRRTVDPVRFHRVPVERVQVGFRVKDPAGEVRTVTGVDWERDDFGNPAVGLLATGTGAVLRVAAAAKLQVAGAADEADRAAALAPLIPAEPGTPEAVVAEAAAAHGAHEAVQRLAARLSRGLNAKSGAHLQNVSELVQVLFLELGDEANAVAVSRLVTGLPYDGNPGRWNPVAQCLALASYIARLQEQPDEAARLAELLRAPDRVEQDAFRAKMNAVVRQRSLNEPNLYDKEIARAATTGERAAERDWRVLRLQALLQLLAHGGSETFDDAELERRISNELIRIRSL
ncbi:MAG: hypothetical protein JWO93_156 [Micrococcaceae bacterium]|jgi:hypothetical protein|nr:hypothetical protein [Micrococcaceae bacterium]